MELSEAVERHHLKMISTDATLDIMKDKDYAQKAGAEIVTNEHALSNLNTASPDMFKLKPGKR